MIDGNTAAERAADDAAAEYEARAEHAIATFGDVAREQILNEAMRDTDVLRDVLTDMLDTTLRDIASAAEKVDDAKIGGIVGGVLRAYFRECMSDAVEVERIAVNLMENQ